MKKVYSTILVVFVTLISYSQSYFIYTATSSGSWYDVNHWSVQNRTDGIAKHQIVIPAAYTITADNSVNSLPLADVEVIVEGRVDLAPNTVLLLSNNSSIELHDGFISGTTATQQVLIGGVVKYQGDLDGLKTGYSIADNTSGVSPAGFRALSTLPVNFTSFLIGKSAGNIQLSWSTDREMNNSHFEIERSFNGLDWLKVAVMFGAGNSDNVHNYKYNDKISTNAVVYYRLRQVDIDGRSVYSSIKSIREGEITPAAKIYGADKNVVIDLNTATNNSLIVSVLTTGGHVVARKTVRNPAYRINISLPNLSSGPYIVQVSDSKGWTEVKKVIL